jgi:hypothetical protein
MAAHPSRGSPQGRSDPQRATPGFIAHLWLPLQKLRPIRGNAHQSHTRLNMRQRSNQPATRRHLRWHPATLKVEPGSVGKKRAFFGLCREGDLSRVERARNWRRRHEYGDAERNDCEPSGSPIPNGLPTKRRGRREGGYRRCALLRRLDPLKGTGSAFGTETKSFPRPEPVGRGREQSAARVSG